MSDKIDQEKLSEIFKSANIRLINAETLALTAMRKAIISGALPPGVHIDEEMVAAQLNLSRSPVRQAMAILESEGLVKRIYRRGVVVKELTAEEIEEIYNIRALLEGLAIRKAVPKYTPEHLEKLKAFLNDFPKEIEDVNEADRFVEWNARFHTMLYEPCEWDYLLTLIIRLRNNTARYIGMSHHYINQISNSAANHQKILEACTEGDAGKAESLMREHILSAMKVLLRSFNEQH